MLAETLINKGFQPQVEYKNALVSNTILPQISGPSYIKFLTLHRIENISFTRS
jgi:hypothetical protein